MYEEQGCIRRCTRGQIEFRIRLSSESMKNDEDYEALTCVCFSSEVRIVKGFNCDR
jgi:hypothetical protein